MSKENIVGSLDFSKKAIWRISWYKDGRIYHDTGYLENTLEKMIDEIINKSFPRCKGTQNGRKDCKAR